MKRLVTQIQHKDEDEQRSWREAAAREKLTLAEFLRGLVRAYWADVDEIQSKVEQERREREVLLQQAFPHGDLSNFKGHDFK